MKVPAEFVYLIQAFHQDSIPRDDQGNVPSDFTEDKWIAGALEFLDEKKKTVVRDFLDELFAGKLSDEELYDIWQAAGPDYLFSDPALTRIVFTKMRGQL